MLNPQNVVLFWLKSCKNCFLELLHKLDFLGFWYIFFLKR